jgi:hypothetical protein
MLIPRARLPLLVSALLCAQASAQAIAESPSTSVVGVVCLDLDLDGTCTSADEPLASQRVMSGAGVVSSTDARGRFSLAGLDASTQARLPSGVVIDQLPHDAIKVVPVGLGPGAVPPPPVVVDLSSGGVVPIELPIRPPAWVDAAPVALGAAAGSPLGAAVEDGGLVVVVPGRAPAGHRLLVGDRFVEVAADGAFTIDLPITRRRVSTPVVDIAPDGRVRGTWLEVEVVPRDTGGSLAWATSRPLFEVDAPPAGAQLGQAALRVPHRSRDDVRLSLSGERLEGDGATWVPLSADANVYLTARVAGASAPVVVPLSVVVREHAPMWAGMADLRLGYALDLPAPSLAGSHVEGSLRGAARVPVGSALLEGAVDLDDEALAQLTIPRFSYGPRAVTGFDRWLSGADAPALLADQSRTRALNPARLPLVGRVRLGDSEVGLGAARAGLASGLTGRIDRPVAGLYADVDETVGPLRARFVGAADAAAAPVYLVVAHARPAHAEIVGTGGTVYRLPHRDVVVGSERLWVEQRDPFTGFARSRRELVRGRDYDIDPALGLVLLAAPLGREGAVPAAAAAAGNALIENHLVADYAVPTTGDGPGGILATRLNVGLWGVDVGGRVAGDVVAGWSLVGGEARVRLAPLVEAEVSAARSDGAPLSAPDSLLRSHDGGARYTAPPPTSAANGAAFAGRLRLGSERLGVMLHGDARDDGYADGTTRGDGRATAVGAELYANIAEQVAGGLSVGLRDARLPGSPAGDLERRGRAIAGQLRATAPVSKTLGVAVEAVSRDVTLYGAGPRAQGRAVGVGGEIALRALDELEVSVGHLQGAWSDGTGPGARDPTVTHVGARYDDGYTRASGRFGLRHDGTFTAGARWSRPDDGGQAYGSFGLNPDDPFAPRGLSTVTGARSAALPDVDVFAESRLVDDPLLGLSAGSALGGDLVRGPLTLTAAYERSRRLVDQPVGESESGFLRVGLRWPFASGAVFTEARRGGPTGLDDEASASLYGGGALHARLLRDLELGGRAVVGQAATDAAPLLYSTTALSWRPSWPVVLVVDHALRQDLPAATDDPRRLTLRRNLLTTRLSFGRLPGMSLAATARGRLTEVLNDEPLSSQAGSLLLRLGLPLFDVVELAIVGGGRVVAGAELDLEGGFTVRGEAVALLGPVRLGLGAVGAGFGGTGIEDAADSLQPPPRVYLVVQGAL